MDTKHRYFIESALIHPYVRFILIGDEQQISNEQSVLSNQTLAMHAHGNDVLRRTGICNPNAGNLLHNMCVAGPFIRMELKFYKFNIHAICQLTEIKRQNGSDLLNVICMPFSYSCSKL